MYSLCLHTCRKAGCGGGGSAPREATVGVFGLDGSGKSTLVSGLKNEARPDDVTLPGTCFKPHELKLRRCKLKAFDVGGHVRSIWKSYYPNVHGLVFVVDGACRQRSAEVKATWDEMTAHEYVKGKPILVVANKQDLEGAMTADEVAALLGISEGDEGLAVRTCHAMQDKMLKKTPMGEGMRWLLGSINTDMDELNTRVETETAAANLAEKERRKKTRQATLLRKEGEKAAAALKAAEEKKTSGGAGAGEGAGSAAEAVASGTAAGPAGGADKAAATAADDGSAATRTSTAWATPTKDAPPKDKASSPPRERRRKKKGGKRRSNRIRPGDDDETTQV